jgi:hypothetical protein
VSENKSGGWKDHPVVIAALSCAAGLVFAYQVIVPTVTASLQNEVIDLKKQIADSGVSKDRIKSLEDRLQKSEVAAASAQAANMFALGNPYPSGLGTPRLGDTLDIVENKFATSKIEKKSGFWSVDKPATNISSVAYYFDKAAKEKRIFGILFIPSHDFPKGTLHSKLVDALGQPIVAGPKPGCFIWKIDEKQFVKETNDYFHIDVPRPNCESD